MKRTLTLACAILTVALMLVPASPADAAMIDIAAAGVSSMYIGSGAPADAVNGVGLTGDNHDTTNWHTGWLSNTGDTDDGFFLIDLKANYQLDATSSLKFWNGRWTSGTSGFKQVKFYLSDDGLNWVEKTATIRDSDGDASTYMPTSTASGFDGTIDFGANATARYIKIQADDSGGNGNWGATRTALCEIQAFGTATGQDPVLSDRITPTGATASSNYGSALPVEAVDGTGLTGTGDEHQGGFDKGWMTLGSNTGHITIDLGDSKTIQGMKIWNIAGNTVDGTADSVDPPRGMRTADIFVSNNGSDWTQVFDNIEIPMGDDSDNASSDYYDSPFVLNTQTAITGQWRYVKISNEGNANPNWGDPSYTGLGEVQLFETFVPEPATMGLLGLGFAGMAALRRRRRRA